jgi:hypothetical protein
MLFLGAALVYLLRPLPPQAFPMADLVPADAVFYAGFPDYRQIELFRTPWSGELRARLDPVRPLLSGPLVIYLDRSLEWVALARLRQVPAALAGAEMVRGAAVAAQTAQALARHKASTTSILEVPDFTTLGSRFFLNLKLLNPGGRLRDFSSVGFDLSPVPPPTPENPGGQTFKVRGRALYRGGIFRLYLERYVQAPRHGGPGESLPLAASFTEWFPRMWEEITQDALGAGEREKAERETQVLSHEFLDGRPFREFLARLGPAWGISIVPTPYPRPAMVVWVDLPDEGTSQLAARMIHRAIGDSIRVRRDRGLAPALEETAEGSHWRLHVTSAQAIRWGESFTPAYTFQNNRFIFSTCASTLSAPQVSAGPVHAALSVDVTRLFEAIQPLAPLFADDRFSGEAERRSQALYQRTFPPDARAALRLQYPDPVELARFEHLQKAQLEAKALEDLLGTTAGQGELARVTGVIETWRERLGWLDRISGSGRFTSGGLEFEVEASPKAATARDP